MIVGVTVDPRDYDRRIPIFPGSRMCRVFGYRGTGGLPSWAGRSGDNRIARLRELAPGIEPACVFQDWPSDDVVHAAITEWLDEIDAPTRLCWRHEADRKRVVPEPYRRNWYRLAEWVHDHARGHLVTLTPTQTLQWTISSQPGKGKGDWSKFYTGIGRPAVDVYANSWEDGYPDPAAFLAPLWRWRAVIDQDIEIPEFGAARVRSDAGGHRRADFIHACASIMAAEGVTAVAYWDDVGSNKTDLRLWTDDAEAAPEVAAWRAVIAEHNTPTVTAGSISLGM